MEIRNADSRWNTLGRLFELNIPTGTDMSTQTYAVSEIDDTDKWSRNATANVLFLRDVLPYYNRDDLSNLLALIRHNIHDLLQDLGWNLTFHESVPAIARTAIRTIASGDHVYLDHPKPH